MHTMNILDTMSGLKDGRDQVMVPVPQKETAVESSPKVWKEINSTSSWLSNPSIGGYRTLAEETPWSLNPDSAASMFPLLNPGWEEDYQDLTKYCQKTQQHMSCAMADEENTSAVRDDELNTPEIRVEEFDYTSRSRAWSRDDASPSLFEDGMLDIPSFQNITETAVKEDVEKSEEKCIDTTKEIYKTSAQNEYYNYISNDSEGIPFVVHEEEVESIEEDVIIINESDADAEMKPTLLKNDFELMDIIQCESLNGNPVDTITIAKPVIDVNVDMKQSLEALVADVDALKGDSLILPLDGDLSLKALLASVKKEEMPVYEADIPLKTEPGYSMVHIPQNDMVAHVSAAKDSVSTTNTTVIDNVWSGASGMGKSNLKLNFTLGTGLIDDPISTPVLMRTLLGEDLDSNSSSFNILDIVQDDAEELEPEQVASTVDFSDVSDISFASAERYDTVCDNNPTQSNDKILNVVIKKSADGQLSVTQKVEYEEKEEETNRTQSGKGNVTNKRSISRTRRGCKNIQKKPVKTSLVLEENTGTKSKASKRKSSGKDSLALRLPVKEEPSTSNDSISTRPSRQRKISYGSDSDYVFSPPPSKRSRQSSVESDSDKYRELRDRNNEASRKSRLNRKSKEQEMRKTAERLEKENQSLKVKAEEMEKLVKRLRQSLLETVMKTKK